MVSALGLGVECGLNVHQQLSHSCALGTLAFASACMVHLTVQTLSFMFSTPEH